MAWEKSKRIVPTDWRSRRARCLQAHQRICHVCGHDDANEADHVIAVAFGGTHEPDNLRPIHGGTCPVCGRDCHAEKTRQERRAGIDRHRQSRQAQRQAVEPHPGLIK